MPVSDQVLRSLDGLSVGDAFGQCFFSIFHHLPRAGETRKLPAPPWMWTDDTMMACGIVEVLDRHGFIGIAGAIAIALAAAFATSHTGEHSPRLVREMFDFVLDHTPASETRNGIARGRACAPVIDRPRRRASRQRQRHHLP